MPPLGRRNIIGYNFMKSRYSLKSLAILHLVIPTLLLSADSAKTPVCGTYSTYYEINECTIIFVGKKSPLNDTTSLGKSVYNFRSIRDSVIPFILDNGLSTSNISIGEFVSINHGKILIQTAKFNTVGVIIYNGIDEYSTIFKPTLSVLKENIIKLRARCNGIDSITPYKIGIKKAQYDLKSGIHKTKYYGKPWSKGKPLVDDKTGFPVEIVSGCLITKDIADEIKGYNDEMRNAYYILKHRVIDE